MALPHRETTEAIDWAGDTPAVVEANKFAVSCAEELCFGERLSKSWQSLAAAWGNLELDEYFGQEPAGVRHRRYTTFAYEPLTQTMTPLEQSPYFQSERMNSYVGGVSRRFGAVLAETYTNEFFLALVDLAFRSFPIPEELAARPWLSQIHQIRITVQPGQTTEVTPEGIHSDGYPFASVHLIDRVGVSGGVSSVYTEAGKELARLAFEDPLDSLLLQDRHLKHFVTPITGSGPEPGHRSILAISFSLPDSEFTTDV